MRFHVVDRRNWRMPALTAVAVAAAAMLLKWPAAAATGVSRGLSLCTAVLIPSLFPFLILSAFTVKAGVFDYIGTRLRRPVKWLFGLPGCAAGAVIIGWIGGYPAGAATIAQLLDRDAVTPQEGRRMLRFCVSAGPAFTVGAVGAGMLGSRQFGLMLWAAQTAAALLIGLVWRGCPQNDRVSSLPPAHESVGTALVDAVSAACRSLLTVCGFAVLFTTLLTLAEPYLAGWQRVALPIIGEVSSGCLKAVAIGGGWTPFWIGFAVGWGGLSVHCQISAILRQYRLVDRSFFAARLIHGLLTGGLMTLLIHIWPIPLATAAIASDVRVLSGNAVTTVSLLCLCAMVLAMVDGRETKIKLRVAKSEKV